MDCGSILPLKGPRLGKRPLIPQVRECEVYQLWPVGLMNLGGRPPARFGLSAELPLRLKSRKTCRDQKTIHAISGSENYCIERRMVIARVRTVASRFMGVSRLSYQLPKRASSRTRSMGEETPLPGWYY